MEAGLIEYKLFSKYQIIHAIIDYVQLQPTFPVENVEKTGTNETFLGPGNI